MATPGPSISRIDVDTRARRRPVPSKGHTKSRRGCYSCKKRKVKCQETLPECAHCTKLGLVCKYPDPVSVSITRVWSPSLSPSAALQSTPTIFKMEDLRFFHHFLTTAYPPLPIQGDHVWQDAAALSHGYDYLIHAMLGLAVSHLALYGGAFATQALSHRVRAIKSLNGALGKPCLSMAEGDARFAAILVLTFQASCMADGMTEYLYMVWGCRIIAETAMPDMEGSVSNLQAHEQSLVDEFLTSLRELGPLCSSPLETRLLAAIEHVTNTIKISAADAFAGFTKMYAIFTSVSNQEFMPFTNPENYGAQLLLIHFFLIEIAVGLLAVGPAGLDAFPLRSSVGLSKINMEHVTTKQPAVRVIELKQPSSRHAERDGSTSNYRGGSHMKGPEHKDKDAEIEAVVVTRHYIQNFVPKTAPEGAGLQSL
ncbi:hypothetical protein B0T22DRAFT_484516 [Podospora appendiculata]|uniref:Zn(2)-C6 fungal-type domain-containing protein n=1 Tax=Podospora appendiculata TaxID=314037 RepID=A0AAE1C835_9PEZI|nr:hypothetical protein B0T22DRAFT_484516 [Podospora appendiculata]